MSALTVSLDLDWDFALHLGRESSMLAILEQQISSELLFDERVREIFDWQMEHLRENGHGASALVLADQFDDFDPIVEPETAISDLISRLRERFIRNKSRDRIRQLADIATSDPMGLSKELSRYGRELASLTAKRGEVFTQLDYERARTEYIRRSKIGQGPSLGFREIDHHFNGMLGVTFLLAPPKTYKSWAVTNAMYANIMAGKKVWLGSLELPAAESDARLRCLASNVPYWKYLKQCKSPEDERRWKEASDELKDRGVFLIEKPDPGERSVTRMVDKALNAGCDAVFIDQLQYVEDDKGRSLGALNNTGDYFDAVNLMRNYSDEIPMLVVHQFNRSVMNTKGLPEMQQGKGSSAIEEVATLALGIWADKEMRRENEIEIGTLCSRNYSYASWRLGVNLSSGCSLELLRRVEDDDE